MIVQTIILYIHIYFNLYFHKKPFEFIRKAGYFVGIVSAQNEIKLSRRGHHMQQGRRIIITGAPGTGKNYGSSNRYPKIRYGKIHPHIHSDSYLFLSKGAIPPYLSESNEQNLIVNRTFWEAVNILPAEPN